MHESRQRALVAGIGLIRVGAAIALGGAPATFLRWEPATPTASSMPLLLRTVGIRDLALGLGTLRAASSGSARELEHWVGAGFVSDALDVGAGLASARTTGIRGVVSAAIALPVAVLDLWTLAQLRRAGSEADPTNVVAAIRARH